MGILGVILGILALACAIFATFLFGTAGAIVTSVLAAGAILLGVFKRMKEKKGGIAAIVIGVLAVVLLFAMTSLWSSMFKELHNKAVELKPEGLWAQASEEVNGGLVGILRRLPQDEATMNQLMEEMNELNKTEQNNTEQSNN